MISFTTLKWAHQDQLVLIKSWTFIDEHFHIHWQTSESCEGTFSHFLANLKAFDVGGAELEQVMDCTLRTILLCKCHSLRLNLCANHLQVVLEPNQLWIHQFAKLGSSQPTAAAPLCRLGPMHAGWSTSLYERPWDYIREALIWPTLY